MRRTWSLKRSPPSRSVGMPFAFHGLQSLQPARRFACLLRLWCISRLDQSGPYFCRGGRLAGSAGAARIVSVAAALEGRQPWGPRAGVWERAAGVVLTRYSLSSASICFR